MFPEMNGLPAPDRQAKRGAWPVLPPSGNLTVCDGNWP